ncbi:hypothetical protein ANABIO4_43550 [Bacillus subtilis]|nr:hypothetical protein [Bacillus subtilis]BAJ77004.1 hypothetical protein [Bacillus subtilis subsp. natto]GLI90975.1 hypothetical protein ANABIO4_43550 [Bacillus subtilis]
MKPAAAEEKMLPVPETRKPGATCRDVAAEERDRCQASRSEPAAAEEKMLPVPETRKPGAAVSVMRAAEEDQCLEL